MNSYDLKATIDIKELQDLIKSQSEAVLHAADADEAPTAESPFLFKLAVALATQLQSSLA